MMVTTARGDDEQAFDVDDVVYLRQGEAVLQARLFRPRGAGPYPAVIELHGGVWTENDRTRSKVHHEWLARHGIAVAALDFTQGAGGYPQALADVNYGIRWVKAHADRLGSRADLVGICGSSSGGHLAMLAAMRPDDPRYASMPLPPGAPVVDGSVRCVVMFWPVINPLGRHHNAQRLAASVDAPEWPPRTTWLSMAFWRNEAGMREGSPLLALMRGERVAMPPALWIQSTNDLIHDYADPTSGFAGTEAGRFVDVYRRAGGVIDLHYYDAPLHFTSAHPELPASKAALSEVVGFIRRAIPLGA